VRWFTPHHGQPRAVRTVLNHLITNAREAMPQGGRIAIATRKEKKGVVCEVSDTGSGIPVEQLHHIFEVYYSTKRGNTLRGMGLAVCREIIDDHGGSIDVESEEGKGTRVKLWFPEA